MYDEYANGTRTSHREELRLANRSGEWIWVLSFGQVAEWDEHGTPVRVLGTSTDITERKQTEAALRNSERRFRALIEQSSDSICVIDADNKILYLSPLVAASVEGYTPEELIVGGINDAHPDDLPLVGRVRWSSCWQIRASRCRCCGAVTKMDAGSGWRASPPICSMTLQWAASSSPTITMSPSAS